MKIYLDNAATTHMLPEVIEGMRPYYSQQFYNASAGYSDSSKVRKKFEECREQIASLINAQPEEIYFTSGGTEGDNWACNEGIRKKGHIITSCIEHKAVLNPLKNYAQYGGAVTVLPVDRYGVVNIHTLKNSVRKNTVLLSVMMANNEIGTIEPVEEIGHAAKDYDILFHTDAVQAFGHIPIDVEKICVDILTASSHKFNGPKGCGFVYIRKDSKVRPFIRGGGQERGMRAGTENVPGIVGMTIAASISCKYLLHTKEYLTRINNYMKNRIINEIPDCIFNGPEKNRLPNNINVSFKDVDAQSLLVLLDMEGICASAGSACNTNDSEPSHVLKSINVPEEYINGSVRFTMDRSITYHQADYVVDILKQSIYNIRSKLQ